MPSSNPKILFLVIALLVATFLGACSVKPEKITRENYEKLQYGMSYGDVKAILGEPTDRRPGRTLNQYTWVSGERHIHAKFLFDKAIYYSSKGLEPAKAARHASG